MLKLLVGIFLASSIARTNVQCGIAAPGGMSLVRSGTYPDYKDDVVICNTGVPENENGQPYAFPPVFTIHPIRDTLVFGSSPSASCPQGSYCDNTEGVANILLASLQHGYPYPFSVFHFDCGQLLGGVALNGTIRMSSPAHSNTAVYRLTCTNTDVTVTPISGSRGAAEGAAGGDAAGEDAAGEVARTLADVPANASHFALLADLVPLLGDGVGDGALRALLGTRGKASRAGVLYRNHFGLMSFELVLSTQYHQLSFTPDADSAAIIGVDRVVAVGEPAPLTDPPADCPLCVPQFGDFFTGFGSVRFVYKYRCNYTCTSASRAAGTYCAGGATALLGDATNATACVEGASGVVIVPCGGKVTTGEILCLPLPTAGKLTQAGLDVTMGALSRAAAAARAAGGKAGTSVRRASDDGLTATVEVLRVLREGGLGYAVPKTCGGCEYVNRTVTPTPEDVWMGDDGTSDGGEGVANATLSGCVACGAFVNVTDGGVPVDADGEYLSARFVVCLGATSEEQMACLNGARCNGVEMSEGCVVSGRDTLCPTMSCPTSGSKKGLLGLLGLLGLIPLLCCSLIICCVCALCARRRKVRECAHVPAMMPVVDSIVGDSIVPWTVVPHYDYNSTIHGSQCIMTTLRCGQTLAPTCQP